MDQQLLSSRAVIGMYYARLEASPGLAWVEGVANLFGSDQASETYPFLGQSPAMREWVGGRQPKGLRGNSLTITNKEYEATLEIRLRDLRRDKTGQLVARVNEFVDRSLSHWASLLSTLILNAATTVCYDGQYYFDTDHSEGDSGTQSNSISVTIGSLPCQVHGSTTAPSVEEMQQCILKAIVQIIAFKDDQGEPLNEGASEFLVKVPPSLYLTAVAAVNPLSLAGAAQNFGVALPQGLKIAVQMNPRLSTWTTKFAVFRTDSPIKGLIRQSEQEVELKVKDESSEFCFDNKAIQIGIDASRAVGYGYWQRGCLVTMA